MDLVAMRDGYAELEHDAAAAQDFQAIPDREAQKFWLGALTHFENGAADCVTATQTLDADLLEQAAEEIGRGNTDFESLNGRIAEIVG